MTPVLLGEPGARSPRTTLYSLYGQGARRQESLREGRWKLHLGTQPRLFDLAADLAERDDLAGRQPEALARLQSQIEGSRRDAGVSALIQPPPAVPASQKKGARQQ
ncbi:MAG: hypothetical protein HC841_06000 [Verrucomicrobiae bacterium]|nr:hypothetical protein [Verrucomicrobiae bacterium]